MRCSAAPVGELRTALMIDPDPVRGRPVQKNKKQKKVSEKKLV
jgi:hypothetical protein